VRDRPSAVRIACRRWWCAGKWRPICRPGEDGATERSDGDDGRGDSNATALSSLARLQLDRQTLEQLGLSHETVATLYRTLYVFTVGFHEHVSNVLDSSTGNQELVSRMWRAYSVMAEELSGQSVETELEEAMVSDSTLLRGVGRRFGADGCAPLFVASTPCCSKTTGCGRTLPGRTSSCCAGKRRWGS